MINKNEIFGRSSNNIKTNEKGITMTVLIITVALMIILAAASIYTLKTDKIVPYAKGSQEKYNEVVNQAYDEMSKDKVFNLFEDVDE